MASDRELDRDRVPPASKTTNCNIRQTTGGQALVINRYVAPMRLSLKGEDHILVCLNNRYIFEQQGAISDTWKVGVTGQLGCHWGGNSRWEETAYYAVKFLVINTRAVAFSILLCELSAPLFVGFQHYSLWAFSIVLGELSASFSQSCQHPSQFFAENSKMIHCTVCKTWPSPPPKLESLHSHSTSPDLGTEM